MNTQKELIFQGIVVSENCITTDLVKTRSVGEWRNNEVDTKDFHLVLSPLVKPLFSRSFMIVCHQISLAWPLFFVSKGNLEQLV